MKKNYLIIGLLFIQTVINAQSFSWLQIPIIDITGGPNMITYPSASDNQGNTFVCGYKDSPFPSNKSQSNLFLTKYDQNGIVLFSKTLSGNLHAHKLETDDVGNLYLSIIYLSTINIDTFTLTNEEIAKHPLLIKLDPNGNYLWHKIIPGESNNLFSAIAIDSNQNLYIGYGDYINSYIEKIDKSNGATLQTITQTQVSKITSIDVDSIGNIYAAGSCAEVDANFNGTSSPAMDLYTTYITKYNANGEMQWVKFLEDIICPDPIVKVNSPNEVYLSSELHGNFEFDSILAEGPINSSDFFIARLNENGNFLWVKEVPGSGSVYPGWRNFLEIDTQGNIYFGGNTRGAIQWNETISTTSDGFNNDIIILKYNPSGNLIWAKTAGGNLFDYLHGISLLPDGNLIITGISTGNTTYDPIIYNPISENFYPFVTRLNQPSLDLPIKEVISTMVFPNPAKENITIQTYLQNGVATLHNILGQKLKSILVTASETTVDISELAVGTYFLKLNSQVIKVIKE
jgi:hypothetical protein